MAQSYHLGANSFVSKTVSFDAFSDTVAKLGLVLVVVTGSRTAWSRRRRGTRLTPLWAIV